MRIPRIPRKPWSVALALAAATALGSGGLALATAGPAAAAGPAFPAHFAAPYLQIGSSDAGDMAADMAATGLKYYTLAFLIPQSGCTPEWEDDGYGVGAFASQISAIQAAGGNVIISFGGEGGAELAQTCTNVSQLTAAYQNVVNTYGVTRLDFDIEGSVAGGHRRHRPCATRRSPRCKRRTRRCRSTSPSPSPRRGCPPAPARSTRCSRTPRPRA